MTRGKPAALEAPSRPIQGFGIVEVLVALGILAVILVSVVALQAASLRAIRAAGDVRDLAAAAEAEVTLRSLLATTGSGCVVATRWPVVATCVAATTCAADGCMFQVHTVSVATEDGRTFTSVGADDVGWLAIQSAEGEVAP